jgi:hypothetical protein
LPTAFSLQPVIALNSVILARIESAFKPSNGGCLATILPTAFSLQPVIALKSVILARITPASIRRNCGQPATILLTAFSLQPVILPKSPIEFSSTLAVPTEQKALFTDDALEEPHTLAEENACLEHTRRHIPTCFEHARCQTIIVVPVCVASG